MNASIVLRAKLVAPLCGLALIVACGGGGAATSTGGGTTAKETPKTAQQPAATAPAAKTDTTTPPAKTETQAVTAASPTTAAAAQTATKQRTPKNLGKLTISQPSQSLAFAPALIADKKGFFKEEGLDAEIVLAGSGSKAGAAVIGGSAQIGHSSLDDMVGAVEKGQDLKVFGVGTTGSTTGIVIRRSVVERLGVSEQTPIDQRVKALKGLKLAISTPGSGTDQTLRFILNKHGVEPESDVEILTTGSVVNSLAAYAQGSADGASLSSPSTETAVLEHDGINLINTAVGEIPELNNQINTGFWAAGDWLEQNPEAATAAVIALWRGQEFIHQNHAEAAEIVRTEAWANTDPKVFQLGWDTALKSIGKSPEVETAKLQSNIDYMGVTSGTPLTIKPEDLGTNKYFEMAKKELGR
ncbi:MAG TPA: ABC transporter substrate-binding protein [Dehalococcoidia bacterium]|nr:ABC transporter substrate-binding protein [Dehalococcoidia bacterium]